MKKLRIAAVLAATLSILTFGLVMAGPNKNWAQAGFPTNGACVSVDNAEMELDGSYTTLNTSPDGECSYTMEGTNGHHGVWVYARIPNASPSFSYLLVTLKNGSTVVCQETAIVRGDPGWSMVGACINDADTFNTTLVKNTGNYSIYLGALFSGDGLAADHTNANSFSGSGITNPGNALGEANETYAYMPPSGQTFNLELEQGSFTKAWLKAKATGQAGDIVNGTLRFLGAHPTSGAVSYDVPLNSTNLPLNGGSKWILTQLDANTIWTNMLIINNGTTGAYANLEIDAVYSWPVPAAWVPLPY